jgi:hypothetical protein
MEKGSSLLIFIVIVGLIVAIGGGIGLAYLQKNNTDVAETVTETVASNPVSKTAEVIDRIDVDGQFMSTRDTQRRADLITITGAVYQYASENDGELPGDELFPKTPTCIGTSSECYDLGSYGIVPTYVAEMPMDPLNGTGENTGYTIFMSNQGRVVATAKGEKEAEISIVR